MTNFEIENLWDDYYPKVYGYFFRRIDRKDEVEDLTSLTMQRFLQTLINRAAEIENRNAYLWQIARNELIRYIQQKQTRVQTVELTEDHGTDQTSIDEFRSSHYQEKVAQLLHCVEKNLQGVDLHIMREAVMNDRTSVELAQELNLKADNIRQKLSRGIKKIRQSCKDLWLSNHKQN
ncbi:MAG: RNA polymerase sigma-70 factor [Patescibacteria group bacterium]